MTIKSWMLYGAYGYTGQLIAEEAVRRGHLPIIAGRDEKKLLPLADKLGLTYRVFDLQDVRKVKHDLEGVGVVLHCAGPFSHTANVMRNACLETGTHYLDITGEIDVLEDSYNTHEKARQAGCVVISGVGFDVMPTDFLALLLKEQLPSATRLELAFAGDGGVSPGTAKTMVELLPERGKIRKDGAIVEVPLAYETQSIRFSDKERFCMSIPWGDISTAYHSTGISDITMFTAVEENQAKWVRRINPLIGCLRYAWLQSVLKKMIGKNVPGPTATQRAGGFMRIWGRVSDGTNEVTMTMDTPEGYSYTVTSALLAVEALLAHKVLPGAYTPSQAFTTEAILGMEGVTLSINNQKHVLTQSLESPMKKKLEIMLDLQDKMNKKVHPEWMAQNFAWFRAIWIECGELVDHYGYKWWKKQTPDMQQVQLEVVDIWHFGLSMLLNGQTVTEIAEHIESNLKNHVMLPIGVIDATEALAESVLATRAFDVVKFWDLLIACEMSFDDLFKQYVGKNVLNFFRQDHGYKQGTYTKIWNDKEDNECLTEILSQTTIVENDFADQVYKKLEEQYQMLNA